MRARSVFLVASALVVVAMGATVHRPHEQHLGLIFSVFILALLVDAYTAQGNGRQWLSQRAAVVGLSAILAFGSLNAMGASVYEWRFPYSDAKSVSAWFKKAGLEQTPLVLMPDAPAFLGYMQRRSAYYPACRCAASFLMQWEGEDSDRMVTEDELENLSGSAHFPVVVVTKQELTAETLQSLRLKELRIFPPISLTSGSVYLYQRAYP